MKILNRSLLPFLLLFTSFNQTNADNAALKIVKTKNGLIAGVYTNFSGIYSFKGIPYASPPVGNLRWREPMPAKPWNGVLKCDHFGASAMQSKPLSNPPWTLEFMPPPEPLSEDCLYLNIWTGARQLNEKKPVIVWIHGGGFTEGSGSVPVYNGEEMAKKGVVFVTINYRLGVFGFLAHPLLSAESAHHVSGNYGILDQIAALKWVKQNIAAFGGDPDNITIGGQSAGSCCVNTLMASPLTKGLFNRGIAESGQFFAIDQCLTLKQAEDEGAKTMNLKSANTLAAMRKLSAEELLKDDRMRLPVVDGYLLTDQVNRIFDQGNEQKADLLIGYNEGDEFLDNILSAKDFEAQVSKQYGKRAGEFLKTYPATTDKVAERSQKRVSRDETFAWQAYTWARLQQLKPKSKVWYYYFDHVPPGELDFGAFHAAEIPYALHTLAHWNKQFTAVDRRLSDQMSTYWVNFAKSGDPNGQRLPRWPVFSASQAKVMGFGDQAKAIQLPAQPAFSLFEPEK